MSNKLTNKQIEYFQGEMPDGVSIVDFRNVNTHADFVEKFCPEGDRENMPYSIQMRQAIKAFIKHVKKK